MNKLLVTVALAISSICLAYAQDTAAPEGETGVVATETPQAAQEHSGSYVVKRYNLFFRINSPVIYEDFQDNAKTIATMRQDIEATLQMDGSVPDSLLILSTASPDGGYEFNKRLAKNRAASTEKLLLEMFPQFKDAHIKVEYLEEDWDGLRQVLRAHPEFPQREEMMEVIYDNNDLQS